MDIRKRTLVDVFNLSLANSVELNQVMLVIQHEDGVLTLGKGARQSALDDFIFELIEEIFLQEGLPDFNILYFLIELADLLHRRLNLAFLQMRLLDSFRKFMLKMGNVLIIKARDFSFLYLLDS